jgi:hypothetical protein
MKHKVKYHNTQSKIKLITDDEDDNINNSDFFPYVSYAFCVMYRSLLQSLQKGHYMRCAG